MISVVIGIVTGYLGGKVDLVLQRFVDAWMSFPDLIILIVVVSVSGRACRRSSARWAAAGHRRLAHHPQCRGVGAREHVRARRAVDRRGTLAHPVAHILPNVLPPIIVLFTTRVGTVILAESGLSFLGLGVPPPAPTWGGMLSGSGAHLHVPGPVAGAGAGPVPDDRGLRHQRVRRCAARSARSAHARLR
jgi:peptide/nickel transport system permease protein